MLCAYKVFLATAYPQSELVGTMKRLLACLVLCASLSASAQDDNCTVLGVQELSAAYYDLNASIDSITGSLVALADSLSNLNAHRTITEYSTCWINNNYLSPLQSGFQNCCNQKLADGWQPLGGFHKDGGNAVQAFVKYADD